MAGVSERVGKYRARMRAAGLRPVQLWVPDTRNPEFAMQCRKQSQALRDDAHEKAVLAEIEAVSDTDGWK